MLTTLHSQITKFHDPVDSDDIPLWRRDILEEIEDGGRHLEVIRTQLQHHYEKQTEEIRDLQEAMEKHTETIQEWGDVQKGMQRNIAELCERVQLVLVTMMEFDKQWEDRLAVEREMEGEKSRFCCIPLQSGWEWLTEKFWGTKVPGWDVENEGAGESWWVEANKPAFKLRKKREKLS